MIKNCLKTVTFVKRSLKCVCEAIVVSSVRKQPRYSCVRHPHVSIYFKTHSLCLKQFEVETKTYIHFSPCGFFVSLCLNKGRAEKKYLGFEKLPWVPFYRCRAAYCNSQSLERKPVCFLVFLETIKQRFNRNYLSPFSKYNMFDIQACGSVIKKYRVTHVIGK